MNLEGSNSAETFPPLCGGTGVHLAFVRCCDGGGRWSTFFFALFFSKYLVVFEVVSLWWGKIEARRGGLLEPRLMLFLGLIPSQKRNAFFQAFHRCALQPTDLIIHITHIIPCSGYESNRARRGERSRLYSFEFDHQYIHHWLLTALITSNSIGVNPLLSTHVKAHGELH